MDLASSIDEMKSKVAFLVAGAQKCGTTAMDRYLRDHPGICMAKVKEVHFFDNDTYFGSNSPDYCIYHQFFEIQKQQICIGEATPNYMYCIDVPRRIFDYNPFIKWIIVLRNPIDRAFSHWNMQRDRKIENLPFLDALKAEVERSWDKRYAYTDRGFYSRQIKNIWKYFSPDQTLFIKYENLKNDYLKTLNKAYDFLEINTLNSIEEKTAHARPYITSMSKEEQIYLKSIFESEIKEVERLLAWDCRDWLD